MTGGYQIIDLGGANFTVASPVTVKGVYAKINGTNKPIMIEHFAIDGTEKKSTFVEVSVSSGNFVFVAYGHTFTIANTDSITIAVKE